MEEVPVEVVEKVEEPGVVAAPYESEDMKIRLCLGLGAGLNNLSEMDICDIDFNALVRLGFEDIFSGRYVGFDINVNLGYMFGISTFGSIKDYSFFSDLLLGASFKVARLDIYLNIGGRVLFGYDDGEPRFVFGGSSLGIDFLSTALLGLRYNFASSFSLALEGQYLYDMYHSTHSVEARLLLGYSF